MSTGTTRIAIVAALVVIGAAIVLNAFPTSGGTGAAPAGGNSPSIGPSTTPSRAKTTTPPPETVSPQAPADIEYAVYNGTYTPRLAAQVDTKLANDGFIQAQAPADSPTKPLPKTIVYYKGGSAAPQNQADAQFIADTYLDGAKVAKLDPKYGSVVPPTAQVAIFLGNDYAKKHG